MANYYGSSRTNYFRVDPAKADAFDAWCKEYKIQRVARDGRVALFPGDYTDDDTFPSYDPDLEEKEGDGNFNFAEALSAFLAPGSVAVIREVGAEKLRYLHGHAVAVDHTGKLAYVNLDDIYGIAATEFPAAEITRAED